MREMKWIDVAASVAAAAPARTQNRQFHTSALIGRYSNDWNYSDFGDG